MPQEPNVDAPTHIWADAALLNTFLAPVGMGWLSPLADLFPTVLLDIDALCTAPPPSDPAFDLGDLAASFIPGAPRDAAALKMQNFTYRKLWTTYCHYTDATPPPTMTPSPEPDGLPDEAPPRDLDMMLRELHGWVKWLKQEFVTRTNYQGTPIRIEESGDAAVPLHTSGDWTVSAAGIVLAMDAPPEWQAHDGVGSGAQWWDLGWFSYGTDGVYQAPLRIQHVLQQIYPCVAPVRSIAWTLRPGVAGYATPLYPATTRVEE